MRGIITRRILIFLSVFVAMMLLGAFVVIQVNAQNQNTNDIAERLRQKGVPLKYVVTTRRLPYEIEIALNSSSDNDQLSLEDNWLMQLARREATLAYRIGLKINSYTLKVYNKKDALIYSTQTYLYPEDLNQQLTMTGHPKVDNLRTKEMVTDKLQLAGLSLDLLDVIPEDNIGGLGQVLIIQVSTPNLDTANSSLPSFLGSLFQMLNTINAEQGTYIVLCHLRIVDRQGTVLLDYVRDLEAGTTQWTSVAGLYAEWYPHPEFAPIEEPKPKPTVGPGLVATQQATPPSVDTYPPPPTPYP